MTNTDLNEVMRRLAAVQPGDAPVLSIYLDLRPQAVGESPGERHSLVILRDRLREIEKTIRKEGKDLEFYQADVAQVEEFMAQPIAPEVQGLAIFSCWVHNLFETVQILTPFDTHISYRQQPELFQLARLADDYETAVVAVVDTNTARLFVLRSGAMREVAGPDDDRTRLYYKQQQGGWSQMRFQRRVENNRVAFAKQSATAIEELVKSEGAVRLLLAGDDVAIPLLREALSPEMLALAPQEPLRIPIRAGADEVQSEVTPLLMQLEAEQDRSLADQFVEQVRGDYLAVAGAKRTRRALEQGQVDTLVLASDGTLDEETRSELIGLAAATSATVEVVEGHEMLLELGGVGGLLRYRV